MFALSCVPLPCFRILQRQILAENIDSEALGKLLPEKLLKPLEEQYLNKHQVKPQNLILESFFFTF